MVSELKTAFVIGFQIYLPFLVIDMVIATVLISMGMMMLPPVLISLPFKLLLFVLIDGWALTVGMLLESVRRHRINGLRSPARPRVGPFRRTVPKQGQAMNAEQAIEMTRSAVGADAADRARRSC